MLLIEKLGKSKARQPESKLSMRASGALLYRSQNIGRREMPNEVAVHVVPAKNGRMPKRNVRFTTSANPNSLMLLTWLTTFADVS